MLRNLVATVAPKTKDFKKLTGLLNGHYTQDTTNFKERIKFYKQHGKHKVTSKRLECKNVYERRASST